MRTGTFYWETEYYHSDNSFTLDDWLENQMQDNVRITFKDGNYCEVTDEEGVVYGLMASGNGDCYSHQIEIERL